MAATHSPTLMVSGFPILTFGKLVALTFNTATSVLKSIPITFALNSRLSLSFTITSSASLTTCAFVNIKPSVVTINPDPVADTCLSGVGCWPRPL